MEEIKAYALSNDDINEIFADPITIIPYPKFAEMESIEEAFDELGRCVYLFQTSPGLGHWCCMFLRPDGSIECFDSYGERPEDPRKWLGEEELEMLGQGEPYLQNLLKKSGRRVYYNAYPYQKERSDVASCGKHCAVRLICKDFSNLQYYNTIRMLMKEGNFKDPDEAVCALIFNFIGK